MTIDTRAYAWCSLGQLSPETPATLADSHVQGSGVVTVRGTVVLRGVKQVAPGTAVDLAYSDGQRWIARVPRRLRVLSSNINPLAAGGEGETTLSVGCKLAYMENRKPPVSNPRNEEENSDVSDIDRRVATPPITAAFVVGQILDALGLTAANTIPLTIRRVVDEWDLSAGYVEELSRIVASEGYFCRVNEAEQLEFISKNQEQGPGVLVTQEQVIELSPMNVGELPGEAVMARYTSLKLVPPVATNEDGSENTEEPLSEEEVQKRNWERETVSGDLVQVIHTYTDASGQQLKQYIKYNSTKSFETAYDNKDRVIKREERSQELNGLRYSVTTFGYPSTFTTSGSDAGGGENAVGSNNTDPGSPTSETTLEFTPVGDFASACGLEGPHGAFQLGNRCTLKRITSYTRDPASGITSTTTQQYVAYINTPFGSDSVARLREAGEPYSELLKEALKLVSYGSEQRIRTEREYGLQKRPGQAERTALAASKTPDATGSSGANSPSVEQKAEIVWALGSSTSQTTVELNPPYVSDDAIVKVGDTYRVAGSNAGAQALAYARIENRLLLANRNGCGLQLQPLHTPPKPFDLIYIRLNGATGCFRVNGTTWTIGPDGAVCTIDALFWGAIDGTVATAWFPLPPGVTSLPATAAVTTNANPLPANAIAIPSGFNFTNPNLSTLFAALPTGQAPTYGAVINPARIVRPYQETVELQGGVLVGGSVEVQTWLPTEVDVDGGVMVGGEVQPINLALEVLPARLELQPRPVAMVYPEDTGSMNVGTGRLVLQPRPVSLVDGVGASAPLLLLHMEGTGTTIVDSSGTGKTITLGTGYDQDITQSTTQKKFGSKGLYFPSGWSYAEVGTFAIAGGSVGSTVGPLTLELFFWLSADVETFGTTHIFNTNNSLINAIYTSDEGLKIGSSTSVGFLAMETWHYIKVTRASNGDYRRFVNSTEYYTSTTHKNWGGLTELILGTTNVFDDSYSMKGYIDEVRIRPEADNSLTVPTAAFPDP